MMIVGSVSTVQGVGCNLKNGRYKKGQHGDVDIRHGVHD